MKKLFLSALLTLGILSVTAGAVSASDVTKPVVVSNQEDAVITTMTFGWGS